MISLTLLRFITNAASARARNVLVNSKKTAARVTKLLPGATIKLLPEAGHVLINLGGQIMEFLLDETQAKR